MGSVELTCIKGRQGFMNKLRLFIAIHLPDGLKEQLVKVQDALRHTGADVKWVARDHFHVTLKFLGETPDWQVRDIVQAMGRCCTGFSSFKLNLSGLGTFPPRGKPRVVWAGLGGEKDILLALQGSLEQELHKLGFPLEGRPYSPHLTLGRPRQFGEMDPLVREIEKQKQTLRGEWQVTAIHLIQSTLTPQGPIYTTLATVPLS